MYLHVALVNQTLPGSCYYVLSLATYMYVFLQYISLHRNVSHRALELVQHQYISYVLNNTKLVTCAQVQSSALVRGLSLRRTALSAPTQFNFF